MNRFGTTVIAVLLLAVFVIVCLAVDYVLRLGLNKSFDKLHNSRKRRKAAARPQGRFRLAERYSETPETALQAAPTARRAAPAQRPATSALSADEWELEEEPASDETWELEEAVPSAPAPQPEAPPTPQPAPSRAVDAAKAETPRRSAPAPEDPLPVFELSGTIPPFQEKRCCICNGELGERYAVLFRAESGAEARIDYGCAVKLNCMLQGSDRREIARAGSYMLSRYQAVDPQVLAFLKRYVQTAADRLRQGDRQ